MHQIIELKTHLRLGTCLLKLQHPTIMLIIVRTILIMVLTISSTAHNISSAALLPNFWLCLFLLWRIRFATRKDFGCFGKALTTTISNSIGALIS